MIVNSMAGWILRYIESIENWDEVKSEVLPLVDKGSLQLYFRLGEFNHIYSHSYLHDRSEPGVFVGVLDHGQMSGL